MKKIDKILEYGFYALVFLLPWQTHLILRSGALNRGVWEYGEINLFGTHILLAGLLLLFFILSLRKNSSSLAGNDKKFQLSSFFGGEGGVLWIILSLFDLAVFVSIFFAPDKILALYRYVLFLLGIGLFWLIVKIKGDKIKLAAAFFSALFIQAVLSIQQFLTQSVFASKWLGMAAHMPADLGVSVVETFGRDGFPERWLRAYGSWPHPNISSAFLLVGLLVLIWTIANHRRTAEKKSDSRLIVYNFLAVVLFAGLIFSFSRSAALALVVGIGFFLGWFIFHRDWRALKNLAGIIFPLMVLLACIFAGYNSLFQTRLAAVSRLEEKSFSERKMYQADSLALLKEHWVFGVGLGNYTKALALKEPKRPWYYLQPVHNTFLLVWAETGIFGLIFFVSLPACLFQWALKRKNVLSLSILAALVIMMLFDHYFWSLPGSLLFFWLSLGYSFKKENI
jgi:hypothetical protein